MMDDGIEIYLRQWKKESTKPRAIVQIAHGMAEHIGRYHHFAQFLLDKNIFVIGNDHRGHGKTGERMGVFGYFAEKDGFDRVVTDLRNVTKYIKKQFPNIPLFLFGHSLGSFLTRRYIQIYNDDVDGVILSGTGGNPRLTLKIGKTLAKYEKWKIGKKEPSHLMNRIVFGSYNKGFENVKSKFTWLSRNEKVVEDYLADPYCGFICSASFFYDLLTGLERIHQDQHIQQIRKNLPFLFVSGDKDPVGANSLGVKKVVKQYQKHGMKDIEVIFYPDARHEVLNEINQAEIYDDILDWIDRKLSTMER